MSQKELVIYEDDVVEGIRQNFVQRGLMKPYKVQAFFEELRLLIPSYKEVYQESLRRNWSELFPGVKFSEELLENAVNDYFEKRQGEMLAKFEEKVMAHKKIKSLFGLVFLRGQLYFLITLLIFPLVAIGGCYLIFYPSDITLLAGSLIVAVYLAVLAATFFIYRHDASKKIIPAT